MSPDVTAVWQLFVRVLRELRDELRPEALTTRIEDWMRRWEGET